MSLISDPFEDLIDLRRVRFTARFGETVSRIEVSDVALSTGHADIVATAVSFPEIGCAGSLDSFGTGGLMRWTVGEAGDDNVGHEVDGETYINTNAFVVRITFSNGVTDFDDADDLVVTNGTSAAPTVGKERTPARSRSSGPRRTLGATSQTSTSLLIYSERQGTGVDPNLQFAGACAFA